jgi:hypothetical protein
VSALSNTSLTLNITGGSSFICGNGTSATYTLNGAPAGASIVWAISNSAIATLSSTGNQATVTKTGNGKVTLTATVGNAICYTNSNAVSKSIQLGSYSSSDYLLSGNNGVPYYCTNQTISFGVSEAVSNSGATGTGHNWNPLPTRWSWVYNGGSYVAIRSPSTTSPPTGNLSVTFQENCGSSITLTRFLAYSSSACNTPDPRYTYSPNPAPTTLNVSVVSAYLGTAWIRKIELVRVATGASVYFQDYTYGNVTYTSINMTSFPVGLYTLRIYTGSEWVVYSVMH